MATRFDNFLHVRARLSGEQLAGWVPGPAAESKRGCRLESDVMVPMQDGIRLSADIYRPRGTGRYPAIVQMAAYSRDLHTAGVPTGTNEIGSPPVMTDRGYAQVVLTRRGMGRSEGESGIFLEEREIDDYCTAIAWVAEQPWCTGDVVMFGTSYYGMIQPLVAARRPPALRAFFAVEICTDFFRHLTHYGGSPNHDFFALWMGANFKDADLKRYVSPLKRALIGKIVNRPWFWKRIVRPRLDAVFAGLHEREPSEAAKRWFADVVFRSTSGTGALHPGSSSMLGEIQVPFVVVQNLAQWSIHQFGSYDLFERAGTPRERRYLIVGRHEYELPVYSWQLEALAFFDWIVKKRENGYADRPSVRYWTESEARYRGAPSFPPPAARRVRLFLRGSACVGHDGTGDAESTDRAGTLTAEPPGGGEGRWIGIPLGTRNLAGIERSIVQVLTFVRDFNVRTHIAGPVTLSLRFSCNEIDSHIVARLSRRDARGMTHLLSLGAMSPARRRVDPRRSTSCEIATDPRIIEPLVPGTPVDLRFSLTPGPTTFEPGDALVLDIASRTDLLKKAVSEGYVHLDLQVPPYFCENTVHFGAQSFLELDEESSETV